VPVAIERAIGTGHRVTPACTIVIGDTPRDIDCARAGRARSIGVVTGTASAEQLRAAGADAVFETLASVDDVLETIDRLASDRHRAI
jgi:phosphoglycolate phosphatase-like HAD superfamily hydrolase